MIFVLFSKPWWKSGGKDELETGSPNTPTSLERSEMALDEDGYPPTEAGGGEAFVPADLPHHAHSDSTAADEQISDEEEEGDDREGDDELLDEGESQTQFFRDDPFENQNADFDFDLQEPRRGTRGRRGGGAPQRVRVRSAKEFFQTELLYRYDILDDQERMRYAGRYQFELKGPKGGSWTVELGGEFHITQDKPVGEVDISLELQHADFLRIVNGELNPQLAVLAQRMHVEGDMRRALQLHELLLPIEE